MEIDMSDLREAIVKASIAHFEGQIEKPDGSIFKGTFFKFTG